MPLLVPSKKLLLPWGTVGDAYGVVVQRGPEIFVRQKDRSAVRRNLISIWRGLHADLETDTQRQLARFFRTITRTVMGRLEKAGRVAIVDELFNPAEFRDAFNRLMVPQWTLLTMSGARFESTWIGDTKRQRLHEALLGMVYQLNEADLPPSFHVDLSPAMQAHIREFLQAREVGVWSQVGATVHDRLRRALRRALKDGDNPKQMQKRVQEVLKNAEKYQAARIARTETTGAMNHGQQLERDDIGIERKEWVSTLDIKTRGSKPEDAFNHRAADGKTVGNSELFPVSGQQLAYPGDSSHGATAGNICNCRCAAVSSFDDEQPASTSSASPAPKKPQVPIVNGANSQASDTFVKELEAHVNSLPAKVLTFIKDNAVTIQAVGNLVDEFPTDPIDAYGMYYKKVAYVAEKPILESGRVELAHPHWRGTANHEIGHSIDHVLKWSAAKDVQDAFDKDLQAAIKSKKLTAKLQKVIYPLFGKMGYKEMVANFFELEFPGTGRSWERPKNVRKLFPETTKLLREKYQAWLNPPQTP